jgi:hypothetical protein
MLTVKIDPLDGKGDIQVAVHGFVDAQRLEQFVAWAKAVANHLTEAEQRIAELEADHGN